MSLNNFLRTEAYHRSRPGHTAIDLLFSSLVVYAVIGLVSNFLSFWHGGGPLIITSLSWKIAGALAILAAAVPRIAAKLRSAARWPVPQLHAIPFIAALTILVFTDFLERRTAFQIPRAVFFGAGAAGVLLLLTIRRSSQRAFRLGKLTVPALVLLQLALTAVFLKEAHGRLIWSDDHPSFLYRLILLRDHFPFLPFYNSAWNAGYSAREVYPTGTLNLYLLGYPIIHWLGDLSRLEGAANYNYLIPYSLLFIVPWSTYLAARLFELTHLEAMTAGFISMGPTMSLFEFALKYGTLPFVLSCVLLVLFLALVVRMGFDSRAPGMLLIAFAALVGFLCATWHLIVLAFLPVIGFLLLSIRHLKKDRRVGPLCVCALLIVILSAPSLITIARESQLFDLTKRNSLPGSANEIGTLQATDKKHSHASALESAAVQEPLTLQECRAALARLGAKTNPLLIVFCLPALFAFPRGPRRAVLGSTICWLLCVSVLGQHVKPQFELHRFFLAAAFLLSIPVGRYLARVIAACLQALGTASIELNRTTIVTLCSSFSIFGTVFAMPATLAQVYRNESSENFRFAPNDMASFVGAVREHGGSGRTFFTGFILHDFGAGDYKSQDGGHIAPLAAFSGKPMYASQYYHIVWSTVDPIPRAYLDQDDDGVEEFLDLVNATSVVTFKREWNAYCAGKERYHEVWHEGRFHLYTRRSEKASYFLEGSGEVSAASEGFTVAPASTESVLKFRWFPKLKTSMPDAAQIEPVPAFVEDLGGGKEQQVFFIRLKVKPEIVAKHQPIRIGYFAE